MKHYTSGHPAGDRVNREANAVHTEVADMSLLLRGGSGAVGQCGAIGQVIPPVFVVNGEMCEGVSYGRVVRIGFADGGGQTGAASEAFRSGIDDKRRVIERDSLSSSRRLGAAVDTENVRHRDAVVDGVWHRDISLEATEFIEERTRGTVVAGSVEVVRRKDGSIIWASSDAVGLSEDRFMAFCSDITETKRLQALESRAERLETAGTIAGQVTHDFNNLLAPLMAYPEFIREELPRNHPALQYLDQIEKASQKIADINQDLLAMGRRGHYNQEVLNLNTVVQHALVELEPYPETLACEIDLSDDLMDILGGGTQLHRMISILLHNAKDAMQDIGQITVKTENYYVDDVSVVYGRVPKGEYVKLTISDTGCGIPGDIVQNIFDPFFTSKTTDKKRVSGLGMSVVDTVIKDHNGYIDLSTKVGEGTSFYIYFPITCGSMDSQDSDETCGGSETILVVVGDDIQREVSSQLLTKLGYRVNSSESGEKAIEFLHENPRDLVILDMAMPGGIDGAETYRRILEISPRQKAIIVSGFSESDRVLEAQKLGAGAFVRKPVSKKVIAAAVRTELDRQVGVSTY